LPSTALLVLLLLSGGGGGGGGAAAAPGEVTAARAIADRALAKINMTAEDEKFAVWVALLNLENAYAAGDVEEAIMAVFKRYGSGASTLQSAPWRSVVPCSRGASTGGGGQGGGLRSMTAELERTCAFLAVTGSEVQAQQETFGMTHR
jgi:hypothetical protein